MKLSLDYTGVNPVVMLCHNAIELTQEAVRTVLAQDIPVELHIVDNCSTDGTAKYFEGWLPNFHTFKPALGVSAGWNFALTTIFRRSPYALVCNNDVQLKSETFRSLIEDGGDFVTAVSVDNLDGIKGEWRKAPRPHPDFSCFMIRKHVWDTIGGFDESMALYASDADYHLRMHQAGIEAYTIGIPFFHYASGTLKTAGSGEKQRIMEQADRDRETFHKKWGVRVGSPEYYRMFGTEAP